MTRRLGGANRKEGRNEKGRRRKRRKRGRRRGRRRREEDGEDSTNPHYTAVGKGVFQLVFSEFSNPDNSRQKLLTGSRQKWMAGLDGFVDDGGLDGPDGLDGLAFDGRYIAVG